MINMKYIGPDEPALDLWYGRYYTCRIYTAANSLFVDIGEAELHYGSLEELVREWR